MRFTPAPMTRRTPRTTLLALLLVTSAQSASIRFASDAVAQVPAATDATERNDQVLTRFVLDCLEGAVATDKVAAVFPSDISFVGSAFAGARLEHGQTVLIERSIEAARDQDGASTVEMQLDEAGVLYQRRGRRELERTIRFSARYIIRSSSGAVTTADRCDATHADIVSRVDVPALELEAFPVTRGSIPGPGGVRRFVAPVVAGAAAAVSAYLLFSLRSDSGS